MSPDNNTGAMAEMPRYKCHKEVHALKIAKIEQSPADHVNTFGGTWDITPADEGFAKFSVPHEWYSQHKPESGGYYVVYSDGYASYSPAKAFDEGYTKT